MMRSIWKARKRLREHLDKTPLIPSPILSEKSGVPVYLKLETMQPSRSFKLRGAFNFLSALKEEEKRRGVSAFSTGNHGLAVAHAANQMNMSARIFVSESVTEAKKEALRDSGAELVVTGKSQDEAGEACQKQSREEGLTIVPPFDHPEIIAGQGTIALELLEDLPEVGTVVAGLSGGGLLAGIGEAIKHTDPAINVTGISVEKGAAMDESIAAGKPIEIPEHPTYADSLLGGIGLDNQYTYPAIQKYVDTRKRLAEPDIAKGMAFLFEHHHLVAEGAAAVGVGALLNGTIQPKGPAVVVVTGAGIDVKSHQEIVGHYLGST
ncbi:hydroxyectoine utilization dehydratase EutB [Salicibibacter halophilus]|uniref:threonine ammonia-lyase n=1 Tax=Salicibibacter halophilus TaxID=2502791 RepID=A0A514LHW7_9BACI|nr:hydroxyectoine utilization dehydratase EutB [Salicibibacter halophilus]QDI91444.1 hydroxyectoine utilization dehydratase EutB [Salicibibacter halophilus]